MYRQVISTAKRGRNVYSGVLLESIFTSFRISITAYNLVN